jgi:hypothetical protein
LGGEGGRWIEAELENVRVRSPNRKSVRAVKKSEWVEVKRGKADGQPIFFVGQAENKSDLNQ